MCCLISPSPCFWVDVDRLMMAFLSSWNNSSEETLERERKRDWVGVLYNDVTFDCESRKRNNCSRGRTRRCNRLWKQRGIFDDWPMNVSRCSIIWGGDSRPVQPKWSISVQWRLIHPEWWWYITTSNSSSNNNNSKRRPITSSSLMYQPRSILPLCWLPHSSSSSNSQRSLNHHLRQSIREWARARAYHLDPPLHTLCPLWPVQAETMMIHPPPPAR